MTPIKRLREAVAASGLRGRGGAGFPTGTKLAAVAERGGRPTVVANGCETNIFDDYSIVQTYKAFCKGNCFTTVCNNYSCHWYFTQRPYYMLFAM